STKATTEATEPAPDPSPAPAPTATQDTPTNSTGDASTTTSSGECKRLNNACGIAPQCGCAPTQTCDIVNSKGSAACITAGNAPMGQPCTASSGCAIGLTCMFGTCHAFCNDSSKPCTQPGTGSCVQVTTEDGKDVPNLTVCRVACAPHDPNSCGGKTKA